ncbi:MAG: tRNA-dihydrouridine synthase, partial [Candidatus Marinimicrobia bacterium]|nr:tRNA-dihydrouridine synthase [Candidatus Neomarinimicrobiota bacterium]
QEADCTDRMNMCKRHLELLIESRGKKTGSNLMRKHFGWYIKGFPGAAVLRQSLVTAKDKDEMRNLLDEASKPAKSGRVTGEW